MLAVGQMISPPILVFKVFGWLETLPSNRLKQKLIVSINERLKERSFTMIHRERLIIGQKI